MMIIRDVVMLILIVSWVFNLDLLEEVGELLLNFEK